MRIQLSCVLLFIAWLLVHPQPTQAQNENNPPPLRRVTLYKHGVGYFERQGKVNGDQQVTFLFDAAQMNDVLKSLVALDLGKGGALASQEARAGAPCPLGEDAGGKGGRDGRVCRELEVIVRREVHARRWTHDPKQVAGAQGREPAVNPGFELLSRRH